MKREDLEHVIAAAATISGDDEIIIVGSQAMLATYPEAPGELLESMEADLYPRNRPDLAEAIHGSIGELTQFHDAYGYYAHGVAPETFTAPVGWEERLVRVEVDRVGRDRVAVGWCLEPHDLVASKCAARPERDFEYARVCLAHGLVDPDVLWARAQTLPLAAVDLEYVLGVLGGLLKRS